jgi:predicted Zn-dependent protease
MSSRRRWRFAALAVVAAVLVACATSPTGRKQFMLFSPSDSEMSKLGATAFTDLKKKQKISSDPAINRYVTCVANTLLASFPGEQGRGWEITVFDDQTPNAFALPGRKIGVHTGILKVAQNQAQLAAVIGHEIGHVEARHSGERLSVNTAATSAAMVTAILIGSNASERNTALAALGVGATVGVVLPFSRTHESEADTLGLRYMARAGFDPKEAVTLWQNMAKEAGGKKPPEFLSTHPADATRMAALNRQLPGVLPVYEQARAQGRNPSCKNVP